MAQGSKIYIVDALCIPHSTNIHYTEGERYIKYQVYKYLCLSAQHYLLHITRHSHVVTEVAITTKIVENKRY